MELFYGVVGFIALVAVLYLYVTIREKRNLQKAETGEDQDRLRQAVASVLPGEYGYRVAYAHWEKVEHFGRRTRTTYYCYAFAFDSSRMWVIPLSFAKESIQPGQPVLVTSEALGVAEVRSYEREGEVWRVALTLHDKEGEKFLDAYVDAENTREDRFHHLNIVQREECERFNEFISSVSSQVTRENASLRKKMAENAVAARGKRARIFAIIGLVVCVVAPIVSIILGCLGLYCAPKPSQTEGKPTAPLILSALSLLLGILVSAVWFFFSNSL